MPLRALLLDFGGTLATEVPSRGELYARSARARNLDIDGAGMGRLMGAVHAALPREVEGQPRYSDAWFERFIAEVFCARLSLPRTELAGLVRELFARFEDPASFTLLPGALELLGEARAAGLRLALVSNWSAHLPALVRRLGLAPYFEVVLTSALHGAEKPAPDLFLRALSTLGVGPGEALHAGNDVDNDVMGAAALGIEPVLVDPSGTLPLPPGFTRVSVLSDLAALVRARRAPNSPPR